MGSKLQKGGAFLFSIFTVFLLISNVFAGEKKIRKQIIDEGYNIKDIEINYLGNSIHLVESGNSNKKALFMIHGSPGNWSAWENLFKDSTLQKNYRLIAIDRIGYGETNVKANPKLEKQIEIVIKSFKHLQLENIILLSHSYGGAIAEKILISNPQFIEQNIYVAPTLSPELQKPKWYNKVGRRVKWILPKDLKSSNVEMLGLQEELKKNENEIPTINVPTKFIHGGKDWLVPIETVDYYKNLVNENVKYILDPEESHFILWSKPSLIIEAILED